MIRALLSTVCVTACASAADGPPPSLSPAKAPSASEAPFTLADLPDLSSEEPTLLLERGPLTQGGLTFWKTEPGSEVFLDDQAIPVDGEGHFMAGFGRDHGVNAELLVVLPDGREVRRPLVIAGRSFPESRITIQDDTKVNPYSEEDLAQIAKERALKKQARDNRSRTSYWRAGFDWPARGRISGVFGSRRILNGSPRRPHSGVDVAAPSGTTPMEFQGTDVLAPTSGIVTLAQTDMFFEGGLIFIDHGQGLESALLHLSRVDVRPGQVVTKGQVVGAVGMTGRATGPHLHWTLNWQGQPLDPQLVVGPMTPTE